MTVLKGSDIEAALKKPTHPVYLIYGPDRGLVNERANRLIKAIVTDPQDPFQLVKLEGDLIASDPARLADEAYTIPMFGGRRAIWVTPTSRNLASALAPLLDAPPRDATILIEADDLKPTSPIRALCEKSNKAATIPCYVDGARDIGGLIDETLGAQGFYVKPETRAWLIERLGGDRQATRAELAKLMMYTHGQPEITIEDIDAVLGDVSGLAMDDAIDRAFAGDRIGASQTVERLKAEGVYGGVILQAALRHALLLLRSRIDIESGQSVKVIIDTMRNVHFRRKPFLEKHLNLWSSTRLDSLIQKLHHALTQSRRQSGLTETIAAQSLLEIARTTKP